MKAPSARGDLCPIHNRIAIGYCYDCNRLYCGNQFIHTEHKHILFSDWNVSPIEKPIQFNENELMEIETEIQTIEMLKFIIGKSKTFETESMSIAIEAQNLVAREFLKSNSQFLRLALSQILNLFCTYRQDNIGMDLKRVLNDFEHSRRRLERFGISEPIFKLINEKREQLDENNGRRCWLSDQIAHEFRNACVLFNRLIYFDDEGRLTSNSNHSTERISIDLYIPNDGFRSIRIDHSITIDMRPIGRFNSLECMNKNIDKDWVLWFVNVEGKLIGFDIRANEQVYNGETPFKIKRLLTVFEAHGLVACADESENIWLSFPRDPKSSWVKLDRPEVKNPVICISKVDGLQPNLFTFASPRCIFQREIEGKRNCISIRCLTPWYLNGKIVLIHPRSARDLNGILI